MAEVKIPDIGDFDDVEIIEILVKAGDTVAAEDPLLTLESDKAAMEIPAPVAGIISAVNVAVGDRVSEGSLVMQIDSVESLETKQDEPKPDAKDNGSSPDKTSPEEPTRGNISPSQANSVSPPISEAAKDTSSQPKSPPQNPPAARAKDDALLPHASPGVRRFARELGADLYQIKGTGPKGRILKDDVKDWVKYQLSSPHAHTKQETGVARIPPIPVIDFSAFGKIDVIKLSRIKKLSGPHLQRAWLNIPHVTHHDDADITDLEAFRQSLKKEAEAEGIRITILSFVMKVLVNALKKYPNFNASLSANGDELILKQYFNIGIAVDTPGGLVVPVVRDVDRKSIFDLARDLATISERARDGKLTPDDLKGGCFSISSLGGIGGSGFTPIINAPEVAILGISRSKMTPVWNGKDFEPRLILPLDLSYDHRVIDGAEAARFSAYLTESFGDVRRLAL